jgi:hypothetical protein
MTVKKKLEKVELDTLRERHQAAQLAEAELAVLRAQLEQHVAKLFVGHRVLQGQSFICLYCGQFNPRNAACPCLTDG